MNLKFESPLVWPDWMPATPRANQQREPSFPARITLEESIRYLEQELADIGAGGTLYLDVEQPLVERLRKKVGSRTGASLKLRHHDINHVIACDRWQSMEHNIYALHLAVRAWRNVERWGVAPLSVSLRGLETGVGTDGQFSADENALTPWMKRLGLGPTATLEDAVAIYHRRARALSQDDEALTKLNILMEEVRAHFSTTQST